MKTYLALITFGILSLQSFATAAEEMIKYPQSLRSVDVKIAQAYTPFGNRLEFNKFGDDGSSCVLDASGVLTWIDNTGTVRVLPNSDLAVPLYVTATECLVWNNRFVDYTSYTSRPNAELKLYRAAAGSAVLTEVALPVIAAKEILDTPPVTNTTSPLTFVASMRKDNGKETAFDAGDITSFVNNSDDCELRVYRLTAGAGVQFLKNYNLEVKSAADFATNSSGPNVSAIGYGSDGSVALEIADAYIKSSPPQNAAPYFDQVLWLDDQGRSAEVLKNPLVTGIAAPRVKILSATKTRLVYEVEQGGVGSFYDLRRNSTTGALAGDAILRSLPPEMTGSKVPPNLAGYTQTNEAGIDFSNYSRVGDNKYFYTVGTLVGAGSLAGTSVISTYQITATNPTLVNRAAPGITISSSALVGTVNPADGSALLDDEDGESLIWLHTGTGYDAVTSSATTGYSALPNSSQAKALFVTNEQAVIWENADAAKNPNGSIPAAIVKHYARDTITGALTASPLALDGTTLLNTPRLTPVPDYWLLTTVQKPQADTSTLRTYALRTAKNIDTDGDGLSNYEELVTYNTDPDKFDTDGDGLSDGEEIANGSDPKNPASVSDHTLALANGGVAAGGTFGKTSGSLAHGASATFTAVPAAGYVFQAWTGDLSGSTSPQTLLMNSNKAVGATFVRDLADSDSDGLSNYDELVTYHTDPNKADTDGDGLPDGAEVNTYKTDPNQSDTDGDLLTDGAEVNTYKTSPLFLDTDGDGLGDKQELVDGTNTFKSSPLLWDTDGDLVSDIDEVNATPPTDPNDPSKYPNSGFTRLSSLHALPVVASAPASVAIDESFAPYGHRPDRDKVGDDGSSVIIDRNGVLIWTNKQGVAVTVPGASLAKTLYVSNTECVVYNNRFAATYNSRAEKAEVMIYRRGATGPVTTSKTVIITGTVLDTCPVTPTTYGFTLVSGRTYEDGAESTQVTEDIASGTTIGNVPLSVDRITDVDQWDVLSMDVSRITWDGQPQHLANKRIWVPNNTENMEAVIVQGHGSDGSLVFSVREGIDLQDRYDDANPGVFLAARTSFWVSLNLGQEKFSPLGDQFSSLAYLTNDRAVLEWENPSTGNYELQDWRQAANRSVSVAKTLPLPAGDRVLPLSTYTIDGLPPYVYTIDAAGTSLRLYKADASLSAVGAAVTLPAKVKTPISFVRNPRDGSLLIQSEDRGLMWIPTTMVAGSPVVTGLGTPQILVNSVDAQPLFVAAKEAVAWLNGKATVINGSLPAAQISHYQINTNGLVVATSLTPPMEGKYVVLPNPLTPDPDLEGWYVTTFEKNAPASTLMRTYQLQAAGSTDRDQDGISDYDEMTVTFTDPGNPDSDGDGLLDGQEVRPYQIVTTALSWENARLDAIAKGGRLAVLDTQLKQDAFKAAMQFQKADGKYWIGGHDVTTESSFQWLDAKGKISGSAIIVSKNWDQYQPSNLNNADGMEVTSGSDYKWSMAQTSKLQGYVIEFAKTDPNNADSDGDGFSDGDEIKMHTDPWMADTDGDGLSDSGNQFIGSPITLPDGNTINYSNALVSVAYEGLVMDPATGIAFKQKLTLTKTGSFTSTLLGLEGDYSYKGTFTSTGAIREDNPDNLQEMGGWLIVDMNLVYQNVSGTYYIQGYFENEAGDQIRFELRPARKDTRYAGKKLNFEASVIGAPAGPTGSAVATGSIHKTTSVASFNVYFPDGSRGSYSGPIVDGRDKGGNLLLPYSFGDLASSPLLVGVSVLRTSANQSDVDGTVRLYSGTSDSANLYPDGFDQLRKLKGSFYVPPASSRLPLSTFAGINNTLYRWTDEGGNGLTGVGTWTSSKLSLSNGPAQGGSATVDRASGLVTVSRIPGIGSEMRQGKAVVLQISKSVKGFYSSSDSMGSLALAPNAGKIPAAVPGVVSKSSYSATAPTATYAVTVKATGSWALSIPTAATWVTATLANTSGTPATPTLVDGSGNGTVTITLAANTTSANRTAVISIAGVEHTVTQAFQPTGISRSSYSGSNAAVSYSVNVVAAGAWSVSIPASASSWVTATPLSGDGNGTVTITLAKNGTTVKTHKNRSTTITIAGRSHTIKQTWK